MRYTGQNEGTEAFPQAVGCQNGTQPGGVDKLDICQVDIRLLTPSLDKMTN